MKDPNLCLEIAIFNCLDSRWDYPLPSFEES